MYDAASLCSWQRDHLAVTTGACETAWKYAHSGVVEVGLEVWGFRRVCRRSHRTLSVESQPLPLVRTHTTALWIDAPSTVTAAFGGLRTDALLAALHGASHVVRRVAPLWVPCSRGDTRTECVHASSAKYAALSLMRACVRML